MKTNKKNKEFAELVEQLTDLSDKDFKEAIKIAKQFKKAQKMLEKAIIRQQKEFRMPNRASNSAPVLAGVDYVC